MSKRPGSDHWQKDHEDFYTSKLVLRMRIGCPESVRGTSAGQGAGHGADRVGHDIDCVALFDFLLGVQWRHRTLPREPELVRALASFFPDDTWHVFEARYLDDAFPSVPELEGLRQNPVQAARMAKIDGERAADADRKAADRERERLRKQLEREAKRSKREVQELSAGRPPDKTRTASGQKPDVRSERRGEEKVQSSRATLSSERTAEPTSTANSTSEPEPPARASDADRSRVPASAGRSPDAPPRPAAVPPDTSAAPRTPLQAVSANGSATPAPETENPSPDALFEGSTAPKTRRTRPASDAEIKSPHHAYIAWFVEQWREHTKDAEHLEGRTYTVDRGKDGSQVAAILQFSGGDLEEAKRVTRLIFADPFCSSEAGIDLPLVRSQFRKFQGRKPVQGSGRANGRASTLLPDGTRPGEYPEPNKPMPRVARVSA